MLPQLGTRGGRWRSGPTVTADSIGRSSRGTACWIRECRLPQARGWKSHLSRGLNRRGQSSYRSEHTAVVDGNGTGKNGVVVIC